MAELDTITGAHHGTAGAMAHDDDQFGARDHGPKLEAPEHRQLHRVWRGRRWRLFLPSTARTGLSVSGARNARLIACRDPVPQSPALMNVRVAREVTRNGLGADVVDVEIG